MARHAADQGRTDCRTAHGEIGGLICAKVSVQKSGDLSQFTVTQNYQHALRASRSAAQAFS